jgi:short chain dehydrogenase
MRDAAETKRLVEEAGRQCLLVAGDISKAEHSRSLVQKTIEAFGRIDVVVNNAAHQMSFNSIEEISDEEWDLTFATNISAMFYITKAAVPHMKPGSSIINTASVNADSPTPQLLAYATTKGAIQNFTGGPGPTARGTGHPREHGGPRSCLDPSDTFHHASSEGRALWRASPDETSGATKGACPGLCDACEQ